ncbi:hypothetical protein GW17_00013380 [Ensete ventricosum]|nr:hypothetical protein GW17_00013380 [Ensete ventricosum]
MRPAESRFLQELVLYAASAALSCLVLFAGLRHLDPNRAATKKALEHKKEIAKRLGRPLVQTNQYEVIVFAPLSSFSTSPSYDDDKMIDSDLALVSCMS